jgi:homopolymeric O-antigen transport system ATP-binding protein
MTKIAIGAEKLGKSYCIGERQPYLALRDIIAQGAKAQLQRFRRRATGAVSDRDRRLWALKDASFDVREGEVMGLIGRNGAGKSTLLKLLARVTKPTEGFAKLRGRLGSLLEVGTGFHSELTGRENVYLSGGILGMKKREIARKFDEIVAFSEVANFIDTPLKHYSSGMQMRLAFAVAAHLEPEILLVDEVLAVGDIAFQKKCMGKMGEIAHCGRTILFVSHNMVAVHTLCTRALLLQGGRIVFDGSAEEAAARYHAESRSAISDEAILQNVPRVGTGKAMFSTISVKACTPSGERLNVAHAGCDLKIRLEIESRADVPESNVAVIIYDVSGYRLIDVNTGQKGEFVSLDQGQKVQVNFHLRDLLLKPGKYYVGVWLGRDGMEEIDWVENAATFEVVEGHQTTKHVIVFPGPYLCRFESSYVVSELDDENSSMRAESAS